MREGTSIAAKLGGCLAVMVLPIAAMGGLSLSELRGVEVTAAASTPRRQTCATCTCRPPTRSAGSAGW